MGSARTLVLLSMVAACGFDPSIGSVGGDAGAQPGSDGSNAAGDGSAGGDGSTGAGDGAATAIGCVPASWTETFSDEFDGPLDAWTLDANASGSTWSTSAGELTGVSTGAGTDVTVSSMAPADAAIVAELDVDPMANASGFRAGAVILRATSIDFADNRFYACVYDPAQQTLALARYDEETQVGSGQEFTELDQSPFSTPPQTVTLTMCVDGTTIACEVPELSVAVAGTDSRYDAGAPGLRVMQADLHVQRYRVFEP